MRASTWATLYVLKIVDRRLLRLVTRVPRRAAPVRSSTNTETVVDTATTHAPHTSASVASRRYSALHQGVGPTGHVKMS